MTFPEVRFFDDSYLLIKLPFRARPVYRVMEDIYNGSVEDADGKLTAYGYAASRKEALELATATAVVLNLKHGYRKESDDAQNDQQPSRRSMGRQAAG